MHIVGQGLEQPSIVPALLDVERHPRKPNYEPADESGLVLYDCGFEGVPFAPAAPPPQAGIIYEYTIILYIYIYISWYIIVSYRIVSYCIVLYCIV